MTVNGLAPLATQQTAQVWSAWTPSAATDLMQVRLNSTNCGAQCSRQGVQTDAIEYRRFESGVTPMWTTLRLPGQQFDEETDLFENWNRFLEPSLGRYLSPDPLLQDPTYVKEEAEDGFSVPTCAYARNNPLRYTDPTGLFSWIGECAGAGVSVSAVLNYEGRQEGVNGRTASPALTIDPLPSSVQYKSPGTSACQDADSAREIQTRYLQGYGPAVRTCWRLMIRQMDAACNLERGAAPKKIPPSTKPGARLTCER